MLSIASDFSLPGIGAASATLADELAGGVAAVIAPPREYDDGVYGDLVAKFAALASFAPGEGFVEAATRYISTVATSSANAIDILNTAAEVLGAEGLADGAAAAEYFSRATTNFEKTSGTFSEIGGVFAGPAFEKFVDAEAVEIERKCAGPRVIMGIYTCPKERCRSTKTRTLQVQKRSRDEGFTEVSTCYVCGFSWTKNA